jgi:hypothetical protein
LAGDWLEVWPYLLQASDEGLVFGLALRGRTSQQGARIDFDARTHAALSFLSGPPNTGDNLRGPHQR